MASQHRWRMVQWGHPEAPKRMAAIYRPKRQICWASSCLVFSLRITELLQMRTVQIISECPCHWQPRFQEQQYGIKQQLDVTSHIDRLNGKGPKYIFSSSHVMMEIDKDVENLCLKVSKTMKLYNCIVSTLKQISSNWKKIVTQTRYWLRRWSVPIKILGQ